MDDEQQMTERRVVVPCRWMNRWARGIDVCAVITADGIRWVYRDILAAGGFELAEFESDPEHFPSLTRHGEARAFTIDAIRDIVRPLIDGGNDRLLALMNWLDGQDMALNRFGIDHAIRLASPAEVPIDPRTGTPANVPSVYSVAEAAHILDRDPAIATGQMRLFHTLFRGLGWIVRQGQEYRPTDESVRLGLLTSVGRAVPTHEDPYPQVVLTLDGLRELHRELGGVADLALLPTSTTPNLLEQ